MGFQKKWRRWILECLKNSTISILVNGSPVKEFKVGGGLSQGDTLSLFIFLLVIECFNMLMKKEVETRKFNGYRFEKGRNIFSLLQYTDIIIIGEKKWDNIKSIKANMV